MHIGFLFPFIFLITKYRIQFVKYNITYIQLSAQFISIIVIEIKI